MEKYDIVIIGGGVAGLVTASGAAQFGAKVALVDKSEIGLGGDCLHYGCVPTKRLVHSAKIASLAHRFAEFGLEGEIPGINFAKVMENMRRIQEQIAVNDDAERFRKMGVNVIFGKGQFLDKSTFEVNGKKLRARRFVIATGSSPLILPIPGLKEANPLTNVTALALNELPQSIAILGAGPIGMEFAQVFQRLGARVTVIEKSGQILPKEDAEISEALREILREEGLEIHTCAEVNKVLVEGKKKIIEATCSTGNMTFKVDEIMVAIGRSPNVEGLNLQAAGIKFDERRGIRIDEKMRTNIKHIFACGDVAGPYAFTHVAEYQAGFVISNALFPLFRRKADYKVVPWVTYTDPELGRVGMTEDEAKEKFGSKNISVYRFSFSHVDRSIIEGEGHGLIKLVVNKKNRLLGAHLLGPHSGELLHEYVLAMKADLPITAISQTIHVYPTTSQAVKRACDQYYKEKLFSGIFPKIARTMISMGRLFNK